MNARADKVLVHQRAAGRGLVSEAQVEMDIWYVLTFREGLIVRDQLFVDRAHALEAAGLRDVTGESAGPAGLKRIRSGTMGNSENIGVGALVGYVASRTMDQATTWFYASQTEESKPRDEELAPGGTLVQPSTETLIE